MSNVHNMKDTGKIIYSATNKVNGKSYIGYCINFGERRTRHLKSASNGISTHFYNAIRKYGKDNFVWTILFNDLDRLEDCKIMEKRMIALFDTYNNGYNSTKGADGGDTYSKSKNNSGLFKKGFTPWNTGMTMSKEHCKKLSEAHKDVPLSKSHAENIGKAHKGKKIPKHVIEATRKARSKPVKQMTRNDELIRIWKSATDAGKFTGIIRQSISMVALGKLKSAGGYKWEFCNN